MEGALEGTVRVFAGEFSRSTESLPDPSGDSPALVLTPGGAACGRIVAVGAATEIADYGGGIRCRLADPTGVFEIEVANNGKTDLPETFRKIPVPSFLAVIGRAQLRSGSPAGSAFIRAESVQIVSRPLRDAWILRTADSTLDRVAALADALDKKAPDPVVQAVIGSYHTAMPDLREIVAMVETALAGIAPPASAAPAPEEPAPAQDAREILIAVLAEMQGPKGMPVEELVAQAALRGIPKDRAEAAIAVMIREDDCYQPQKGSVRLL